MGGKLKTCQYVVHILGVSGRMDLWGRGWSSTDAPGLIYNPLMRLDGGIVAKLTRSGLMLAGGELWLLS